MAFRVFTVPLIDPDAAVEELNRFLRSHRIVAVKHQLAVVEGSAFWAYSVEYSESEDRNREKGGSKVDYREILGQADFRVFARLREWRKEVAEKDGVPVYTVFNNEQLAEIVRRKVSSQADLGKIDGIGEARVAKYGDAVLQALAAAAESPVTS